MTRGFWGRIQGGHTGHDGNGGIARGDTPESSGSYGFIQLGGDLFKHDTGTLSLTSGLYGAAGQSSVDVKTMTALRQAPCVTRCTASAGI